MAVLVVGVGLVLRVTCVLNLLGGDCCSCCHGCGYNFLLWLCFGFLVSIFIRWCCIILLLLWL